MKILRHHHVNGELQRSEVEENCGTYVRVDREFSPLTGELRENHNCPLWFFLSGPINGDKRLELCLPDMSKSLERDFVTELIRLNLPPKDGPVGAIGPQELPGFGGVNEPHQPGDPAPATSDGDLPSFVGGATGTAELEEPF